MPKIIILSADYPPIASGEANHTFYLASNLASSGAQVTVITSEIPNPTKVEGVEVLPVMPNWGWSQARRLISLVRDRKPDAVLLIYLGTMYRHHPMITYAPNILRLAGGSLRFVTQFEHITYSIPNLPLWSRAVRKALRLSVNIDQYYGTLLRDSHHIIVLSEMHRDHFAERFPNVRQKYSLVPPPPIMAVTPEEAGQRAALRKRLGVAADETLLIYYGYIYPSKGVETMLQAFRILVSGTSKAKLLIVGGIREHLHGEAESNRSKQYLQEMMDLPKDLNISNLVHWAGPCPMDSVEASAYFRASDVCILPFDIGVHLNNSSVAAAMVHGLPVVTTEAATTEAVFSNRGNVMMCPPKQPERLAGAIRELLSDEHLRRNVQAGATKMAEEWFSWTRAAARTLAVLTPGLSA